jgi:hypothetical protein
VMVIRSWWQGYRVNDLRRLLFWDGPDLSQVSLHEEHDIKKAKEKRQRLVAHKSGSLPMAVKTYQPGA